MTQWVPPPWPELPWANERTKAILSAERAILGKTPPISMPGTLVFTAPTALRNSTGADILGSNVSTWVGPPPNQSQMTEVFLVDLPACLAAARKRSRSGSTKPVAPSAPILRKSRRLDPSQSVLVREPRSRNMVCSFHYARATRRERPVGVGIGRQRVASVPPGRTNH